jgi:ankyrin repeat protein
VWDAGCRVEQLFYHVIAYRSPLASLAWVCAHQEVDLGLEVFSAARCRSLEAAVWLLDRGADIHTRKFGETCLMVAAEGRQLEMMQLFVDRGADPRATNARGETALDYAIYCTDLHDPDVPRDAGIPDLPAVRLRQSWGVTSAKR